MTSIEEINHALENSPFIHGRAVYFMVGCTLYFVLVWAVGYQTKKWQKMSFKQDQLDNMIVVFMFGMALIVWDTQLLHALEAIAGDFWDEENHLNSLEHNSHYYFILAPAIDRVYMLYVKLKSKLETNEED